MYTLQLSRPHGKPEDEDADSNRDCNQRVWSLLEFTLDGEAGSALAVAFLADLF